MFLLVPAWPRTDEAPPITACLVAVTCLVFLLTWPLEQSRQSVVTNDRYQEAARGLAQLLLAPASDLKAEDRALLEAEQGKDPYPTVAVLSLFQRINETSQFLS